MKRLLLTTLLCLTLAQQICANDTLKHALQIAGTHFGTVKDGFDRNILAQATVPVAAGATLGALATVASATWYNCRYYRYKAEGNTNPLFINTIMHGGAMSSHHPNFYNNTIAYHLKHGSELAGNCLSENMCQGIVWGGLFGLIYSLYKHRFTTEGGIVSLGTVITGFIFRSLTGQYLSGTGKYEQCTFFSKTKI
jgi:hypothetical protein